MSCNKIEAIGTLSIFRTLVFHYSSCMFLLYRMLLVQSSLLRTAYAAEGLDSPTIILYGMIKQNKVLFCY